VLAPGTTARQSCLDHVEEAAMFLRLAAVCAALASPALADCVSFDDFAKGVTVKQADGSVWTARRGAHEVIRLDQTNAKGVYAKYVEGAYGVYPAETTRNGIGTTAEYRYARTQPEPALGMDWTSNVRANDIPAHDLSRQDWQRGKARVTAGDLRQVTIGGCDYQVMAVDMAMDVRGRTTVLHYAYFPDLRFGTQTRITYQDGGREEAGIVAMMPLK
jgi:hypothetical protein